MFFFFFSCAVVSIKTLIRPQKNKSSLFLLMLGVDWSDWMSEWGEGKTTFYIIYLSLFPLFIDWEAYLLLIITTITMQCGLSCLPRLTDLSKKRLLLVIREVTRWYMIPSAVEQSKQNREGRKCNMLNVPPTDQPPLLIIAKQTNISS